MKVSMRPWLAGLVLVGACSSGDGNINSVNGGSSGAAGSGAGGSSSGRGGGSGSSGNTGGTAGAPVPDFTFKPSDAGAVMVPPDPNAPVCGQITHKLDRLPPELLLVLDRSKTMGDAVTGSTSTRFAEVRSSLDAVVNQTQSRVFWGLKMFPTVSGCNISDDMEVPVALENHAAMSGAMNGTSPNTGTSGTPMQLALRKATAHLLSRANKNPKYLVLGTDGLPNCRNGSSGSDDTEGTTMAIADAAKMNVRTFVIGIATHAQADRARTAMNAMADAGGEPRTAGGARFYEVANRQELTTVLNEIAARVSSCVFPLDKQPPVPGNVQVRADNAVVMKDTNNATGWNYGAGMQNITIYGPICEQLKAGKISDVQITFGCPNKEIE
jgi:hypothetical protein